MPPLIAKDDDGIEQDIAHHLNQIHHMWMINKATKLKDVDNRDHQEALNAFQAMACNQKKRIIDIQEKVVVNANLYEAKQAKSKEFIHLD